MIKKKFLQNSTRSAVVLLIFWSGWINTAYSHTKNFEIYQDDQLIGAVTLQLNPGTSEEALATTNRTSKAEYHYYFNRNLINPLALFDITPRPYQSQLTCFHIFAERAPNQTKIETFKNTVSYDAITTPDQSISHQKPLHTLTCQKSLIIDPVLDIALSVIVPEANTNVDYYAFTSKHKPVLTVVKDEYNQDIITLTGIDSAFNFELKTQQASKQSSTITANYTTEGHPHELIYKQVKVIDFPMLKTSKKRSYKAGTINTAPSEYEPSPQKRHRPSEIKCLAAAFQTFRSSQQEAMDTAPARLTVTDWAAPENPDFIHDLQEHGDKIYTFLKKDIEIKPRLRTCPMPGMTTFVTRLVSFVNNNILTDAKVPEEDKGLYKELTTDLQRLVNNNYPWNQSFTLAYKAAHFVSFYNKDKARHYVPAQKRPETDFQQRPFIEKHRSYYKETATLAGLALLPWQDALDNPSHFTTALNTLWHSYHLKFTNSSGTILEPLIELQEQKNFCFPCMDKLDIPFFNCTWMLGIHPVGFILEPETLFDGAYGLCADFFEHDLLHTGTSTPGNPAHFLPAKILAQAMDSASIINRDHLTLDTLEHSTDGLQAFALCQNQLDFPKEALELSSFEAVHERGNTSLILSSWDNYRDVADNVFSAAKDRLRFVYSNLPPRYQAVTFAQVKQATLLLYSLNKKQFWDSKNSEEAENRRKEAWYYYNNMLFYNTLYINASPVTLDVALEPIFDSGEYSFKSEKSWQKIDTILKALRDRSSILPASLYDDSCWMISQKDWAFYNTDNPRVVVCKIKKSKHIPDYDNPHSTDIDRNDIHVFNHFQCSTFKNIDNIQYDKNSGILTFRQSDKFTIVFLKGEHAPSIKEFSRTLVKDIHLNFDNKTVQLFTPQGIQNLNYGVQQNHSPKIPYAGQHLAAVDFNDADLAADNYTHTTFENCNLSQTKLTWDNIKTSHFCGYSLFEPAKLNPAACAAEAWLKKADGDLTERLKAVHESGLLPFIKLNALQWHKLLELQPWSDNESGPLKIANIPFQALLADPSKLTDSLCRLMQNVLLSENTSLKLGTPCTNQYSKVCTYPIVKHLLTALNGPEDIRLLINQNPQLHTGKLDCFDSICFNPEKLKIPKDHKSRWFSALCRLSFKSADLSGCDFKNINIAHCDFTDARLEGVNFTSTDFITGNVFTRANLRGACFAKAEIPHPGKHRMWISNSNRNNFEQADMRSCDMTETHLGGCSFKNAVLDGAQLGGLYLVGNVDLQGASLRDCWILGRHTSPCDRFAEAFLPALPKTSPSLQDQLNRTQMLVWLEDTSAEDKAKTLLPQLSPVSMNDRERRHYIDLLEATGQPDVKLTEAELNACIEQKNTKDIGKYLIIYLRSSAGYQGQTSPEEALATAQIKCRQLPEKIRSEIASHILSKCSEWINRNIREQMKTLGKKLLHPEQ